MTADVVNLRQFRKAKARSERESEAEQKRIAHGRTKAEKSLTQARKRHGETPARAGAHRKAGSRLNERHLPAGASAKAFCRSGE